MSATRAPGLPDTTRGHKPEAPARASRSPRWRFGLVSAACLLSAACQQQMAVQPSVRPDEPNAFFKDRRGNQPLPAGTVARGHLRSDPAEYTGRRQRPGGELAAPGAVIGAGANPLNIAAVLAAEEAQYVEEFPFPITRQFVEHGFNRYMIYCVVCHDPLGTGRGKIVERSYTPPPSYHIERLRKAPVGHLFAVITEGYGSMPDYRQQIPPRDRWAIVAYIRLALQPSQHFPAGELTGDMRRDWDRQKEKAAAAAAGGEK